MFAQQPIWGNVIPVSAQMTGDDLLRLPDDGSKNELFEGVLIKDTMTTAGHGIICHRLGGMLFLYAMQYGFTNTILQNALFDLTPVGVQRRTVMAPDISIMRGKIAPATNITMDIPLIAVEVVSPSQTLAELAIKAQFYHRVGVEEVWLIDPDTRVIEMWTAHGQTTLNATQSLTSALLPSFMLDIKYLLDG